MCLRLQLTAKSIWSFEKIMRENSKRLYFIFVFALIFYVTGASFVQSFVNYPTWKLIGASEFKDYHNAMSPLIIKFMVLPWMTEIVLTISLFWLRPRAISAATIALALILNLIVLVSTATIQIPIQSQLGANGFSLDAINRLLETDPIRWVCGSIRALLFMWMMAQVIQSANLDGEVKQVAVISN